jgi:hypothetical protein
MLTVLKYGSASRTDLGPLATPPDEITGSLLGIPGWFSSQPFVLSEHTRKQAVKLKFSSVSMEHRKAD